MDNIIQQKKQDERRRILASCAQKNMATYTASAIAQLSQFHMWNQARTVLAYVPAGHEIPFIQELFEETKHAKDWFFASIQKDTLVFYRIHDWKELSPGTFSMYEPPFTGASWKPSLSPTICLVPALAVDSLGRRLGRGGGYYDRFLNIEHTSLTSITVVPDFCYNIHIPTESHDVAVDFAFKACPNT